MKTARFIILILLVITIAAAAVVLVSASYFSWDKKNGFSYEKQKKIKLACIAYIFAAFVALIIVWLI